MKLTKELMNTEVMCCGIDARVDKVAKMMRFTDQSYIPIVTNTKTKKVVSSISERDLIEKVLCEGRHPVYTFVEEILADEDQVTCGPNAPIDLVLSLMSNNGITSMPVVNRNDCLLGIISLSDIADYYQYDTKMPVASQSA